MPQGREIDRAIAYINQTLKYREGMGLSDVQEVVIRGSLAGLTYQKMVQQPDCHYCEKYLKEVGSQLWNSLSQYWGVRVSKPRFRAVLHEQLRQQPPSDRPSSNPDILPIPTSRHWHHVFKPILLRASQQQNWLPGYTDEDSLGLYERDISSQFAQLRQENCYEALRQQWQEVRGLAHVYDWTTLRCETLQWLHDRAREQGDRDRAWHDRAELAWVESISGRPGVQHIALQQMSDLWQDRDGVDASPLARLELLIYLCATTSALRQYEDMGRWLRRAKELIGATDAPQTDWEWQRCRLDVVHYSAERLHGLRQWHESAQLYEVAIDRAQHLNCGRAVARNQLGLAQVELSRSRAEAAQRHLSRGFQAVQQSGDRRGSGFFAKEQMYLAKAKGDRESLLHWHDIARDRFQSLGMTVQLQRLSRIL